MKRRSVLASEVKAGDFIFDSLCDDFVKVLSVQFDKDGIAIETEGGLLILSTDARVDLLLIED